MSDKSPEILISKDTDYYINLNHLIRIYLRWKWFIIISVIISFLYNVYKLRNAEFLYEVSLQIIAVTTFESNKSMSAQNSFANFFGVSASNSSSDFALYKSLISSKIIAEKLSEDGFFMETLFGESWDSISKKIKVGTPNFSTKFRNSIKSLLGIPVFTGQPSSRDAVYNFLNSIKVKHEENPNFIELKLETSDTRKGVLLIEAVHKETDDLLKERSFLRASNNLNFIKSKLLTVKQEDQKQTLINSLSSQQNAIMSSSTDLPYVAETFGSPAISSNPVTPKPKLILALSIIYGLVFSLIIVPIIDISLNLKKTNS